MSKIARDRLLLLVASLALGIAVLPWPTGAVARNPRQLQSPVLVSLAVPPRLPSGGNSVLPVWLTFSVSVCLADVEYSIACKEASSLEAAKRLEQLYLDAYANERPTGSLKIWFPLATEQSEQLAFLRDVEHRAIAGVIRKLQNDPGLSAPLGANLAPAPEAPQDSDIAGAAVLQNSDGSGASAVQKWRQDVQRWREDAEDQARKGTNWEHDWASRTHSYKPRPTLDAIAQIKRVGQNHD